MTAPQAQLNEQALSADLSVAPQLGAEAMAWAAQAGFRSVVNNRPDFEGGLDQPTSAAIGAAAAAAGLAYVHQPVQAAVQTADEVARFAALLAELPKPILAFCRTGTRSGKLYRASMDRAQTSD